MAFILPSNAFEGGSPAVGALTGLFQGLSQGIQAQRQQDLAQQHLQIQQAERALRQRAYEHGLQNEQDIKAWAQKYGEFKAWDLAGQGAQPIQGPPTPTEVPGDQSQGGPMPNQPGPGIPLGMGPPNHAAWIQKVQELAQTLPNDERLRGAFLDTIAEEKQREAIHAHAERISNNLNDLIAKKSFSARLPGGVEDDTGNVAARQIAQQMQGFLASPEAHDPRAAAQYLDHIDAQTQDLLVHTAQSNTFQHLRDMQVENMQDQINQARARGVPPSDLAGAVAYLNNYKSSVDQTPKDLGTIEKEFADELSGMGPLRRAKMSSDIELAHVKEYARELEQKLADQRKVEAERGRNERAQLGATTRENIAGAHDVTARDVAEMRQRGFMDREALKDQRVQQELGTVVGGRSLQAAMADKDWPNADTDEKKAALIDRYDKLQQRANGSLVLPGAGGLRADSAAAILRDADAGVPKEQLIQRAQKLGYKSYAEVQAAAGGK